MHHCLYIHLFCYISCSLHSMRCSSYILLWSFAHPPSTRMKNYQEKSLSLLCSACFYHAKSSVRSCTQLFILSGSYCLRHFSSVNCLYDESSFQWKLSRDSLAPLEITLKLFKFSGRYLNMFIISGVILRFFVLSGSATLHLLCYT
jgi:hypothetical protein